MGSGNNDSGSTTWLSVLPLALGFFLAQVMQELAMEGLFTHFDGLQDSEVLTLAATFAQFVGCIIVPMIAEGAGGKSIKSLAEEDHEALSSVSALQRWLPFIGLTVLVMTTNMLGTQSVRYVQYPIKVVFKSTKLIPTMLISTAMGNARKWSILDYSAALLLCGSAAVFAMSASSPKSGAALLGIGQATVGIAMLLVAVCTDALVPNCQQWVLRVRKNRAEEVMIRVNMLGALGTVLAVVLTGNSAVLVRFLTANPHSLTYLAAIGALLGCGVFCYTLVIQRAGSVAAVAVATCRKVATLVFSFFFFPQAIRYAATTRSGAIVQCDCAAIAGKDEDCR